MSAHVALAVAPDGKGKILINGMDLSTRVSSVSVQADAARPVRVGVELVRSAVTFDGLADLFIVGLDSETHAALVAAGWTPPAVAGGE